MKVAIQDIIVGERRREDMGDIDGLAQSIVDVGLLHPIVIDDQNRLVAGGRRLAACKSLGLADIEVKRLGELSDDELRQIELEENLRRKNLEPHERSKFIMAVKAEVEDSSEFRGTIPRNSEPRRGRPGESGSTRDVAAKAGVNEKTVRNAAKHVEAIERYPFMERWPQSHVLEAAKVLNALSDDKRDEIIPQIQATTQTKHIGTLIQRLTSPARLTSASPLLAQQPSQSVVKRYYEADLRAAEHHLTRASSSVPSQYRERIQAILADLQQIISEAQP